MIISFFFFQEASHDEKEAEKGQSSEKPNILGEGGTTGDFPPDTSVVFATLEVCLCAIVRHIPVLNPSSVSTGFQPPTHLTKMGTGTFDLISGVMVLMVDLVSLCSPVGKFL